MKNIDEYRFGEPVTWESVGACPANPLSGMTFDVSDPSAALSAVVEALGGAVVARPEIQLPEMPEPEPAEPEPAEPEPEPAEPEPGE